MGQVIFLAMLFADYLLKYLFMGLLWLLHKLGWKKAGEWLDALKQPEEKPDDPVV